jgi:predicted cobalt transporter CbtA
MTTKGVFTSLSALVASLALAAPAFAQSSTDDMYQEFRNHTFTHDPSSSVAAASSSASSSLPFTGFELAVLILAGLVVIATGLLLRRAARSD